jgi:protein-S-isoprenylcysteine O-methyltransferase Ste14
MSPFRHLRAIGLLPVVATIVIPAIILYPDGPVNVGWGLGVPLAILPPLLGGLLVCLGGLLAYRTIALFATVGRGTLAPWDPTRKLVVEGPYRRVRNPMISGVMAILLGEAVGLGSPPLLIWFALFFTVNAVYMPLVEEPGLARRFGDDYAVYKRNVPRWLPRPRPWTPG